MCGVGDVETEETHREELTAASGIIGALNDMRNTPEEVLRVANVLTEELVTRTARDCEDQTTNYIDHIATTKLINRVDAIASLKRS